MCGALAISAPAGVEQRAGEIEPLLDVDRGRGRLQRDAHLLGDRHEQVVEDLEPDRVDVGADRVGAVERDGAGQDQRAVARRARRASRARRRWSRSASKISAGPSSAPRPRRPLHRLRWSPSPFRGGADRFDDQRVDDQLGVLLAIAEAPAVERLRRPRASRSARPIVDLQRGVAARQCAAGRGGASSMRSGSTPCSTSASRAAASKLASAARKILAQRLQPARARGSPSRRRGRCRRPTARRRAGGSGSAPCRARRRRGTRAGRPRRRSRRACSG